MTIDEFSDKIAAMAIARMGVERYCGHLRHETREDKYLREKYLAIQAVVRHKGYPGDATIELGDEKEGWDARVGGTDLFEIVQALPAEEYLIRKAVAGGKAKVTLPVSDPEPGEPAEMAVTGPLACFLNPRRPRARPPSVPAGDHRGHREEARQGVHRRAVAGRRL